MGEVAQLVALFVCVGLALTVRVMAGSWAHPAAVTAAAWTLLLAIPTVAGLTPAPFSAWLVVAIVLAALVASPVHVPVGTGRQWRVASGPLLRLFVLAGTVTAPAAAVLTMRANGITLGSALDLATISAAAREVTWLRYGRTLATPALATLLLGLTYGAALAAPYAAASRRGAYRLILLAGPTVGAAAYAMATTARAALLITATITAGTWLVVRGVETGGRFRLPARSILGLLVAAAAVAVMFGYVAVSRMGGVWTPGMARVLADKFAIYAGGGLPAFEQWVNQDGDATGSLGFGAHTVAGVGQYIAYSEDVGKPYEEVMTVGPGMTTNVYTILRPLSDDFGIGGALLVLAGGVLLVSAAFRHASLRGNVAGSLVAALWCAMMLYSLAMSFLMFTNVCFGLGIGAILVLRSVRFESGWGDGGDGAAGALELERAEVSEQVPTRRRRPGRHAHVREVLQR